MLTSDRIPDAIARALVDPIAYAEWDGLHLLLKELRNSHPFARGELEGYDRFWVASKYEDIQEIGRRHDIFQTGVAIFMSRRDIELEQTEGRATYRSITRMNAPEHLKYRILTQSWFQPKNLRDLDSRFRLIARRYIDHMVDLGGECDFFKSVAVHYPLLVIASILGLPDEAEPLLMRLTQNLVNMDDPDVTQLAAPATPEERAKRTRAVADEAWSYFSQIAEERRRRPTPDVASVIANATIDGAPISDIAALGYYITIATAGHDTTAASVAGGLWALAERPDELAKVKGDLSLLPSFIEEAVRWTTPIYHFTRTAVEDTEFRGQKISKGDRIILLYLSGNRDEDVFSDPFDFKVDRSSSKQIGFGYGPHVCLGQHLARMEMSIFFQELLPRLESLQLSGAPQRKIGHFQGGPKSVPIRYKIH